MNQQERETKTVPRYIGYFRHPQTGLAYPIYNTDGSGIGYASPGEATAAVRSVYAQTFAASPWIGLIDVKEMHDTY